MNPQTFQITDGDGQPVTYLVIPHPWSEGLAISTRLMAAGVDGLAGAIQFKDIIDAIMADKSADLKGMLTSAINPGALLEGVKNLLMAPDSARFIAAILRYSTRNGVPLERAGVVDLSAYQGNYGELWRAVYEVIRVNRFLSLPITLKTGGNPL